MNVKVNHQQLQLKFGEFPELLFGKLDNGRTYFDGTHYLIAEKRNPDPTIAAFIQTFAFWIKSFSKIYSIPEEEMFVTDNVTGHQMIEECLALLLLAYSDPIFGVYIIESMTQMLIQGIACSDTYILMQAHQRFDEEELLSTSNLETL